MDESEDFISDDEREHLLSKLHLLLVWAGEQLPDTIELNGNIIQIHELVWNCIHRKDISKHEKERLTDIVHLLDTKEKYNEEILKKAGLTKEEAKKLYHETAAIIRAIMCLRDCREGKIKLKESRDEIKQKIEDTKRWLSFLKGVNKKDV